MQAIKILVVEDSPLSAHFLKYMLSQLGYQADFVNNAEQALLLYRQHAYDLIFNDIHLPKMNGIVLTQKIRQYEKQQGLSKSYIVMLSASHLSDYTEAMLLAGVNMAMKKPIQVLEIANVLETYKKQLIAV